MGTPSEVVEGAGSGFRGEFTDTAYVLPDGLSFDEWASEGPTLIRIAQASMWWIGDWIRYGEHAYGERYAQAIHVTGFAEQTLRNAVWVCERIPPTERNPDVPFSHHKAVAALPPADRREVLAQAEEEGLAEFQVRRIVRERKDAEANPVVPPAPEPPYRSPLEVAATEAVAALHEAESAQDWTIVADARARLELALEHADA